MNMMYICIAILAYFLPTLNWQVLWGKEKYLLNTFHEKLKNKVSLKEIITVENLFLPKTDK